MSHSAKNQLAGHSSLAITVLRLADDHLVLGHRLSEWCGHAPMLEEDLSMPNMALDLLGQSLALYEYLVDVNATTEAGASSPPNEASSRFDSADAYAYLRREKEYLNCLLVEKPDQDFAFAMLKQFYFSAFMLPFWQAMQTSTDEQLCAIAAKAELEITYHLRHSGEWVIRLGDGTQESHQRMQDAVDYLHRYTGELFFTDAHYDSCVDAGQVPDLSLTKVKWDATVKDVFERASLNMPELAFTQGGGREGRHTEDFGFLLAELQYMQRAYPGAQW